MKRGTPVGSKITESSGGAGDGVAFPRSQDHFDLYTNLIRWELEDEMESVEERLRKWSRSRLVENGVTLFDLEGRNDGWLFGERIV